MASWVCLQYLCNYSHFQKLETEVLHYRFKINSEQMLSFKPAVLILGVGLYPCETDSATQNKPGFISSMMLLSLFKGACRFVWQIKDFYIISSGHLQFACGHTEKDKSKRYVFLDQTVLGTAWGIRSEVHLHFPYTSHKHLWAQWKGLMEENGGYASLTHSLTFMFNNVEFLTLTNYKN